MSALSSFSIGLFCGLCLLPTVLSTCFDSFSDESIFKNIMHAHDADPEYPTHNLHGALTLSFLNTNTRNTPNECPTQSNEGIIHQILLNREHHRFDCFKSNRIEYNPNRMTIHSTRSDDILCILTLQDTTERNRMETHVPRTAHNDRNPSRFTNVLHNCNADSDLFNKESSAIKSTHNLRGELNQISFLNANTRNTPYHHECAIQSNEAIIHQILHNREHHRFDRFESTESTIDLKLFEYLRQIRTIMTLHDITKHGSVFKTERNQMETHAPHTADKRERKEPTQGMMAMVPNRKATCHRVWIKVRIRKGKSQILMTTAPLPSASWRSTAIFTNERPCVLLSSSVTSCFICNVVMLFQAELKVFSKTFQTYFNGVDLNSTETNSKEKHICERISSKQRHNIHYRQFDVESQDNEGITAIPGIIESTTSLFGIIAFICSICLFIYGFIGNKAFFLVFVASSFRPNSALSISAFSLHTCVLQTTMNSTGFNALKCFGTNDYGQCGYEHTTNIGDEPNEMAAFLPNIDTGIATIDEIKQVETGAYHTCILTHTGKAKCFGRNNFGQLGIGNNATKGNAPNTMSINLPFIDFGGSWVATQLAAGLEHTCALLSNVNGTAPNVIKCFGNGQYGGLGYGDTERRGNEANEMGDYLPPIDLGNGFDPIQIAVRFQSTCALSASNKIKCFGKNGHGQLGIGDTVNRGGNVGQMGDSLPFVQLGSGFTPIQIECGYRYKCVLSDLGEVKCWGKNTHGVLGYGHTRNIGNDSNDMGDSLPRVDLGSNLTVTQISAGKWHICALFTIGQIKCWGFGANGRLGYGNTSNVGDIPGEMGDHLPFVDLGIGFAGEVVEVTTGGSHTCAASSSNQIKCWGSGGQLGSGNTTNIGDGPNEMGDYLAFLDLDFPTINPSTSPTSNPTRDPSTAPTDDPSISPTHIPSYPTNEPTATPTKQPSLSPTHPSLSPSDNPSLYPTYNPSTPPTLHPSSFPTSHPSASPSVLPSLSPTHNPTNNPTATPTRQPSASPSDNPSSSPSAHPSLSPSNQPSTLPSRSTNDPSILPSMPPSAHPSLYPSRTPTSNPSINPSSAPTDDPSAPPTSSPSLYPSTFPSSSPTNLPTDDSKDPTTTPTYNPSLSPGSNLSVSSSAPSRDPIPYPSKSPLGRGLTHNPSPMPTSEPSISPSILPTPNPSLFTTNPSVTPSLVPTPQPSRSPLHPGITHEPSASPTNNPSQSPSVPPSLSPTSATQFPFISPSSHPTISPSDGPSVSPTVCFNDAALLTQYMVVDPAKVFRANNDTYQYENIADARITCDKHGNVCLIHCVEYEGCIDSKVIIEEKELSQIIIDCNASFSCAEVSVQVRDSNIGSISVLCAAEHACDGMVIDINVETAVQVNALCIADNACDNLVIIGDTHSEHVNINLTVTNYSSDISIQYHKISNIFVGCKSPETKFIQYNTDKLMHSATMKRDVRRQYAANRMPCEDVSISCSQSSECEFAYSLSSKFNISHILRAKEYTDCLWIDINDIYDVECNGECALMRPFSHDISFHLDVTFEDNNGTDLDASSLEAICDKHLNSINSTKDSLQSIDVIFSGALAVLKSTESAYDMINELVSLPITRLRNDLDYLECNLMENPLKLATELSLSSNANDEESIHELFTAGSLFAIESELLIEDLFATKVSMNITVIAVFIPSDVTGIPTEIFVSSGSGLICLIIILSVSILYCYKKRHKAMDVSNPMVIGICIGQYNNPIPNDSEIDGYLGDLFGIDEDIRNVIRLYRDVLNYEIYPRYDDDGDGIKQHWTKDEIVSFLSAKARDLDASLDTYDGLVVVISSHGMDNCVISSDYKKLNKLDIHRAFSVDYPDVRDIPRCFIFDCCDGTEERDFATREYINEDKKEEQLQNASEGHHVTTSTVGKGDSGVTIDNASSPLSVADIDNASSPIHSFKAQNSTLWAQDENNPDYKLAVINAANTGFQSKMNTKSGSYCIRQLIEKMRENIENNGNKQFLIEIVEGVEAELHDGGKQLIDATYKNKTGYIKFRKHHHEDSAGVGTALHTRTKSDEINVEKYETDDENRTASVKQVGKNVSDQEGAAVELQATNTLTHTAGENRNNDEAKEDDALDEVEKDKSKEIDSLFFSL